MPRRKIRTKHNTFTRIMALCSAVCYILAVYSLIIDRNPLRFMIDLDALIFVASSTFIGTGFLIFSVVFQDRKRYGL